MVLGETPTTSAASSDDELAEEEDESVESLASNLSVLGTLVDPSQVHHIEIRTDTCRATVAAPDGEDPPIICCRGPRCRSKMDIRMPARQEAEHRRGTMLPS